MLNLTDHDIAIRTVDGRTIVLPPSGEVARILTKKVRLGEVMGIPIFKRKFRGVRGIPKDKSIPIIVSNQVFSCITRPNMYAPDTGRTAIRDLNDKVIAVTQLISK